MVELPIALFGDDKSTSESFSAEEKRPLRDVITPGAIDPPNNSLFSFTAINFVAVPKSTMMTLPRYLLYAETASTNKSEPNSLGLAILIVRFVSVLGVTKIGSFLKYNLHTHFNHYRI